MREIEKKPVWIAANPQAHEDILKYLGEGVRILQALHDHGYSNDARKIAVRIADVWLSQTNHYYEDKNS